MNKDLILGFELYFQIQNVKNHLDRYENYFISVIWPILILTFVLYLWYFYFFLATLFSKYGPNFCKLVILTFQKTSLHISCQPGHSLAKICVILYRYTKWYFTTKVIIKVYFSRQRYLHLCVQLHNRLCNRLILIDVCIWFVHPNRYMLCMHCLH